jgi:hypothetical protein
MILPALEEHDPGNGRGELEKMANEIILDLDPSFDFFRPGDRAGTAVRASLDRRASVKDLVESCGIPHTEIGYLGMDGKEVGFSHIPRSPGRLTVRGISPPFDVERPSFLRPEPLSALRFIADANVIRLGRLMLILGFDTALCRRGSDKDIARQAQTQGRIVLTRDTALLKRKRITFARRVRADLPYDQVFEVVHFFGLEQRTAFFSRCTACNALLEPRAKDEILHLLEPKTRLYFHRFFQCPECGRIFWRGSHVENMREKFSALGISING